MIILIRKIISITKFIFSVFCNLVRARRILTDVSYRNNVRSSSFKVLMVNRNGLTNTINICCFADTMINKNCLGNATHIDRPLILYIQKTRNLNHPVNEQTVVP